MIPFLARLSFALALTYTLAACSPKPSGLLVPDLVPVPPDYGTLDAWAAHPDKEDTADKTPKELTKKETGAGADVFFLHPTTFTGKSPVNRWNADLSDPKLRKKTEGISIQYQGSIFNEVGRVFAPHYRQAHLGSFFTKKWKKSGQQALEIAYQDVKAAFEYYLEHYNQGRPIILAGHSQGGFHGIRLLDEYFDSQPLRNQLVVAYLVGFPIKKGHFKTIPVCETETQIHCFCSWRTFKEGYFPNPEKAIYGEEIAVVNPLSWTTDTIYVPREMNEGAVLIDFDSIIQASVGARIHQGMLWTNKPKFKGSFWMTTKNYHPGDFNLFYVNVRKNAWRRLEAFLDN